MACPAWSSTSRTVPSTPTLTACSTALTTYPTGSSEPPDCYFRNEVGSLLGPASLLFTPRLVLMRCRAARHLLLLLPGCGQVQPNPNGAQHVHPSLHWLARLPDLHPRPSR